MALYVYAQGDFAMLPCVAGYGYNILFLHNGEFDILRLLELSYAML